MLEILARGVDMDLKTVRVLIPEGANIILGQTHFIKMCPEVCRIFCATANALEVVVAETDQGRGIMGVIDGSSPKGLEKDSDKAARKALLRNFGYKVK